MKRKLISPLPLPKASIAEDLETISRNKVSNLFDPALFEIRSEAVKDKGVDLIIELKQNCQYTNFRFAIQIKSTETTSLNKDSSISIPIEVSNINYLISFGMPAYYILYEHNSGNFYLETAYSAYNQLIQKYQKRAIPQTFRIRFKRILTKELISEIYEDTIRKGVMLKKINEYLPPQNKNTESNVVIDGNYEVYSTKECIEFIEKFGFHLIYRGECKKIIELEQKAYPHSNSSATFNLVCGVAHYHQANLFKAFDLLKQAKQKSNAFDEGIRGMLEYTLCDIKYLIGIIDRETFLQQVKEIDSHTGTNSFIKIENAYHSFNQFGNKNGLKRFYSDITNLISEAPGNNYLLIIAYGRILEAEAKVLLDELSMKFILLAGWFDDIKNTKAYKRWAAISTEYLKRLASVSEFALKLSHIDAMINLGFTKIHWVYVDTFSMYVFENWNRKTLKVDGFLNDDARKKLNELLIFLDSIEQLNRKTVLTEALISCLFYKFEILCLLGLSDDSLDVADQIRKMIEQHDLVGLKGRFENLINSGTGHERFIRFFTSKFNEISRVAKASGLGEYWEQELSDDYLHLMDEDLGYSIDKFFELPSLT